MTQSLPPIDSLLVTIVLTTLSIGLPIVTVLAIRFLWERNVNLGRSKELEKLIWQLHRIASALEHQMNLSFPAVQPGTEEPRDRVFRQPPVLQSQTAVTPNASATIAPQAGAQEPAIEQPAAGQAAGASSVQGQSPAQRPAPRAKPDDEHARVNSMFGLDR